MARPDMLKDSLIVAAHPDDELLWFNAILADVDDVLIIYKDFWADPAIGEARAKAVAEFPRDRVELLGLEESGVFGCADWANPTLSPYGLDLTMTARLREVKRQAIRTLNMVTPGEINHAPDSVASMYRENFRRLTEDLRDRLRPGMNVFTHNPWGEYGHEEHVQLFRVLDGLRDEIGFNLWMSNYCTERTLPLARLYFSNEPADWVRLRTNKEFADAVANVYKRHGCWTWSDDWAWFEDECYMIAPRPSGNVSPDARLLPLNLFGFEADTGYDGRMKAASLTVAALGAGWALGQVI